MGEGEGQRGVSWSLPLLRSMHSSHVYSCGGPKLASFSGLASAPTPRARWNILLGYQPPFDRHDWVVDRCGTKVEYVIDFYAGKETQPGQKLNFYLDVRPKLNSWEAVKTRAMKFVGL